MNIDALALIDIALLLVAVIACRSRKVGSLQLVMFWSLSCGLFLWLGDSVYWFAVYSSLCTAFALATKSFRIACLFLVQIGLCAVVTFEWTVPGLAYVYNLYSWIVGACFLLQIGVAASEQGYSFSCNNHRDLFRALRSSIGAA